MIAAPLQRFVAQVHPNRGAVWVRGHPAATDRKGTTEIFTQTQRSGVKGIAVGLFEELDFMAGRLHRFLVTGVLVCLLGQAEFAASRFVFGLCHASWCSLSWSPSVVEMDALLVAVAA